MKTLAAGMSFLDLRFQGVPGVIATAVLQGGGGIALVDPGPSSGLPSLRAELGASGIAIADVTALLLTHIHLDHAGATGTLVNENPKLRVFVHEIGAPHLIDPTKLLASAERLYGDAMDRLWGEVRPVPEAAIVALRGGERLPVIGAGSRELEVMYTPGHASHHVSYVDRDTGVAFVGDTAGVRLTHGGYVLPPTPPPDIDLDAWSDSLRRIERQAPDTLFLTHFGPWSPAAAHLREMSDHLEMTTRLAAMSLERSGDDQQKEEWFVDAIRRELRRRMGDADAHVYEVAGRFDLSWRGLARYLRKKMK